MDALIGELSQASNGLIKPGGVRQGQGGVYVPVLENKLNEALEMLSGKGFELVNLFGVEGFEKKGFTLIYTLEKKGYADLIFITVSLAGSSADSVAAIFPSASWYERGISDGFGITFNNSFDSRRLFLHEAYPEGFHPLLKSFKNNAKLGSAASLPVSPKKGAAQEYAYKEIEGEGVYVIPVGPVHAGIIEPGHFRFSVIGETIYALEIRMFYKHRGVEKLAEGKPPSECVKIAESISGDETVANSVAFCSAVEDISSIKVPDRALYLRSLLLEMERIYSHLGDMAGMAIDVAFAAGASPFFVLREEVLRQNEALTGSRFMKGTVSIGGLTKETPDSALKSLGSFLEVFSKRFSAAVSGIHSSTSTIDRFDTTGVINKELLSPLHITGPAARASGSGVDTRVDHPYGIYSDLQPEVKTKQNGDVLSRFDTKAAEIDDSIRIIKELLRDMPKGSIQAAPVGKIKDGHAGIVMEAPRGQSFHWVMIRGGVVYRYAIRTPSFCNWQAIEHAVIGNIVPDFPLINKSLNLSYAGTDL